MQLRLEKRLEPSLRLAWWVRGISLLLALLVGALLLLVMDTNPIETYRAMFRGSVGSSYGLSETLVKAIPLMLTGLAVSVAFQMRFWNIGAEGQLAMGIFGASGVALFGPPAWPWLPQFLWLPLVILAGMAAGAFWGLIPAYLKAQWGVNEIITTLMFNYIAIRWLEFLIFGPWRDPDGFGFPQSALFADYTWLPRLTGRLHIGLLFALVAALLLWFIIGRTRWGYELRLLGENPVAARYSGISVLRTTLLAMAISGALAGLAGVGEVAGISHRLQQGLTLGYGFTGIIVAWLARLNPWGVLLVAFALAALLVGGDQIQMTMGLPASLGLVLQGIIFFFVLGGDIFTRYRVRVER
ncbi:MAG: ABC transporter permease [Anaerolineales bacterium]|nr:ABC transporter permease [Anaerolineales bacterium]MCB9127662.1 ABC transporter permease [Ardenticatenales bacterium]